MLNALQQLLNSYSAGSIDYQPFREECVSKFLEALEGDPWCHGLYNRIESTCAAYDNGFIDEPTLKATLSKISGRIKLDLLGYLGHIEELSDLSSSTSNGTVELHGQNDESSNSNSVYYEFEDVA